MSSHPLEMQIASFERTDAKIDALQWRMTSLVLASWITLMAATLFRH